ncbi:MAG TPA: sigma-70 family RNA polymerase sigma factor, partial [Blastocatellia bacterium]|nr:sigma-70 family RNA polymerase sigma factor [Blastocatellia bacterium]
SLELSRNDSDQTLGSLLPSAADSPEEAAISSEREKCIMRALMAIKPEYRVALILREVEELSYEEIADALSISIGTVKSRIARGREDLRKRVKNLI